MLLHKSWRWRVFTLCRASDPDREPKFRRVMEYLGAEGAMADLDDGPEQMPLPTEQIEHTVETLLPRNVEFDVLLTHGPDGEYTRHARHEECCRAVVSLWCRGLIRTKALWCFAYDDGHRAYLPRVRENAELRKTLPEDIWRIKYRIITEFYGFAPDSWEARVTPREEGFVCFDSQEDAGRIGSNLEIV